MYRPVFGLPPFLVEEEILRDGAQPGHFVRLSPEILLLGEGPEECFLRDLFRLRPVTRQCHYVGEHPHVTGCVELLERFLRHFITSLPTRLTA